MKTAKELLQVLQDSTYICSKCGKTIYPKITGINVYNEELIIENTSTSCRGGAGNKLLADNICDICVAKAQVMALEANMRLTKELDELLSKKKIGIRKLFNRY